ncbi:Alpha/Beta hydrolase protein [Trametes elegans]|nr:Alpha/Beta hydrolase protein [Trametes elegans]
MAYNYLAEPDTELEALLATWPRGPEADRYLDDIPKAREYGNTFFVSILRKYLEPRLPVEGALRIEDHQVPVESADITVRSYTPIVESDPDLSFPLLVWFHGGGWTLNNIESDDYWLRILSAQLRVAIVNVEYRLAPENPWPIPFNDSYAAVKWAVDNVANLRADLSKAFILGGPSAGAHLSASLTHRINSDPYFASRPKPTGQLLIIPAAVHPDAVPEELKANFTSMEQNADAPLLSKGQLHRFYELVKAPPFDPNFSPLLHPLESFQRLPSAYVQICGQDPLRDGGLFYLEKMKAAGVPIKVDLYPGAPHGFMLAFPQTKLAQKSEVDLIDGIKWLLSRPTENAA